MSAAREVLLYAHKRDPTGYTSEYPFAEQRRTHTVVAEAALGRPLPRGAEVHHVNEDKWDNRPCNLVVCQDRAYHMLLHRRARALREGGSVHANRCYHCGGWGLDVTAPRHPQATGYHASCARAAARRRSGAVRQQARANGLLRPDRQRAGRLSPALVREIRSAGASGTESKHEIALRLGVSTRTIGGILDGTRYSDVD